MPKQQVKSLKASLPNEKGNQTQETWDQEHNFIA